MFDRKYVSHPASIHCFTVVTTESLLTPDAALRRHLSVVKRSGAEPGIVGSSGGAAAAAGPASVWDIIVVYRLEAA